MTQRNSGMGGGVLIAIGAIGGSVAGLYAGQPSIGLIGGIALGGLGALAIWLLGRR